MDNKANIKQLYLDALHFNRAYTVVDDALTAFEKKLSIHDASIARQARMDELRQCNKNFGYGHFQEYLNNREKELSSSAGNAGQEKVSGRSGEQSTGLNQNVLTPSSSAPEAKECKTCGGSGGLDIGGGENSSCSDCYGTGKSSEAKEDAPSNSLPSEGNKWTPALLADACEKLVEDEQTCNFLSNEQGREEFDAENQGGYQVCDALRYLAKRLREKAEKERVK